jgi:NAD+ synthase (glutamine-hydrolysing)
MRRMESAKTDKLVVGVSGGADSSLALIGATKALGRSGLPAENLMAVVMPGFGSSEKTQHAAKLLAGALHATCRVIDIRDACQRHLADLGHPEHIHDTAYENAQARERTQILMDIANQEGALVIGTGDLSELALGWCTYNGDHMSMYGVNASVPKTLIRHLVRWAAEHVFTQAPVRGDRPAAEILIDVTQTPISPELMPGDPKGEIQQKTEDIIGPYELHDFFLYNFLRYGASPAKIFFLARCAFEGKYDDATLLKWEKKFFQRFFSQQFKRSCMPDGPKISVVSLSPRGDWRMASDAQVRLWAEELAQLG